MKDINITIKFGSRFIVLLSAFIIISTAIFGFFTFLFLMYFPLNMFKLRIKLDEQSFKARVVGAIPLNTEIDEIVKITINEVFPIKFPFHQDMVIPINETFNVPVELETNMPINMIVKFDSIIPVTLDVPIDSIFQAKVFGIPMSIPVKGTVPLFLNIPVRKDIPINENIKIKFKAPVKVVVNSEFKIPINTDISIKLPFRHDLIFPLKTNITTKALLKGDLPDLQLLDNTLDIGFDQLGFAWDKKVLWLYNSNKKKIEVRDKDQ